MTTLSIDRRAAQLSSVQRYSVWCVHIIDETRDDDNSTVSRLLISGERGVVMTKGAEEICEFQQSSGSGCFCFSHFRRATESEKRHHQQQHEKHGKGGAYAPLELVIVGGNADRHEVFVWLYCGTPATVLPAAVLTRTDPRVGCVLLHPRVDDMSHALAVRTGHGGRVFMYDWKTNAQWIQGGGSAASGSTHMTQIAAAPESCYCAGDMKNDESNTTAMCFDAAGTVLCTPTNRGVVSILDATTLVVLREFSATRRPEKDINATANTNTNCCAISPSGRRIAMAGPNRGGQILVYEVCSGELLNSFDDRPVKPEAVIVDANGDQRVQQSGSVDEGTISRIVWLDELHICVFERWGRARFVTRDHAVLVYNVASGALMLQPFPVDAMSATANRTRLAVVGGSTGGAVLYAFNYASMLRLAD